MCSHQEKSYRISVTATLNSSTSLGNMKSYGTYFLVYVITTDPSVVNHFGKPNGIAIH